MNAKIYLEPFAKKENKSATQALKGAFLKANFRFH